MSAGPRKTFLLIAQEAQEKSWRLTIIFVCVVLESVQLSSFKVFVNLKQFYDIIQGWKIFVEDVWLHN